MSDSANQIATEIVVKFMAKKLRAATTPAWRRQLPSAEPRWGSCRFVFDADCRNYDWLVVYDDVSPLDGERFSTRIEPLACARQQTILVTAEPSSIKIYERIYCDQFGLVITSQEPWAIAGKNTLFLQSGFPWFYGRSSTGVRTYEQISANPPVAKTRLVSTVCSSKVKGSNRLYKARLEFTERLEKVLPELDRFGRGVRDIDDKAVALDDYRYHIAIENDCAPHYFTEKLTDPFLGASLPFYHGCPNAADYFPADSFIPIDIFDFDATLRTIRTAIETRQYEKRLPHILEARRRALDEHNLFAMLATEIEARHASTLAAIPGEQVFSRRALRKRSIRYLWRAVVDKRRVKREHQRQIRSRR